MLDALCAQLVFASAHHDGSGDVGRAPTARLEDDQGLVNPLLSQIRSADEREARGAFEQLFHAYYTALCSFAVQYVHTAAFAEEIVSDVFARLWTRRGTWAPRESVAGYLYGAVRYAALNAMRGVKAERLRDDRFAREGELTTDLAVDADTHTEHLRTAVWNAVASLPEPQRSVIMLRWQRGLGWPAIAEALGTTVGAAKMHQSRALKVLRERLPRYLR